MDLLDKFMLMDQIFESADKHLITLIKNMILVLSKFEKIIHLGPDEITNKLYDHIRHNLSNGIIYDGAGLRTFVSHTFNSSVLINQILFHDPKHILLVKCDHWYTKNIFKSTSLLTKNQYLKIFVNGIASLYVLYVYTYKNLYKINEDVQMSTLYSSHSNEIIGSLVSMYFEHKL